LSAPTSGETRREKKKKDAPFSKSLPIPDSKKKKKVGVAAKGGGGSFQYRGGKGGAKQQVTLELGGKKSHFHTAKQEEGVLWGLEKRGWYITGKQADSSIMTVCGRRL